MNESTWEILGDLGFSGGYVADVGVGFARHQPHVAFLDVAADHKASVMFFSKKDQAWSPLGNRGFSPRGIHDLKFGCSDQHFVVAFQDHEIGNALSVMAYKNGAWVFLGPRGFLGFPIGSLALVVDQGQIWVAFRDVNMGHRLSVMTYTGLGDTGWSFVGQRGISRDFADRVTLAVFRGHLYVAYVDGMDKAHVMIHTQQAWIELGGDISGDAKELRLGVCAATVYTEQIYLAFSEGSKSHVPLVKAWDGKSWNLLGEGPVSEGSTHFIQMAMMGSHPVVAFQDGTHHGSISEIGRAHV